MKTISPHINTNHHEYYKNYDHITDNMNRNASISQAEYQRDACEEELYRLRYGIEQLLANTEQGNSRNRYRPRSEFVQNSYKTGTDGMNDLINRKDRSWFERCTPCCRRWRRTRYDDYQQYPSHSQDYSDSFVSPSPSIFSRRTTLDKTKISDLLASKNITDPVYQSLILKILEAKALDCLCSDYSKQNIQQQISQTLTELNQKTRDDQWDSTSVTSSAVSPTSSYDSSSSSVSVSSNISNDESISSRSITPHSYSPSPISIQTPSRSQITPSPIAIQTSSRSQITPSPIASPINSTGSLKLNEENESSKTKPKVSIIEDKKLSPSKSKTKKKTSSKQSKKKSKSKSSKKKPSKPKSSKSKSKKSKSSKKKPTSSKSPSKHKSHKSKHKKKPKSNNQVHDHQSYFHYPPSENRQRHLHNLFDSLVPASFNGNRRI